MSEEINWKNPQLQALLAQNARRSIELNLFDKILSEDWDGEFYYPEQEYTTSTHDRLVKLVRDYKELKHRMEGLEK